MKTINDVISMVKQEQVRALPRIIDMEYIKNKGRYSNYKIITFDIESWGLNPQNLAMGIFYDGVNYLEYFDLNSILKHIDNIEEDTLIYAHNGMKYDFLIFIDLILNGCFKYKKSGDICILSYKNRKGINIVFKDSIYLFNQSLKNLGKSFGCGSEKGITPLKFIYPELVNFTREEFEKDRLDFNTHNITPDEIKYCRQDCKVLYDVLNNKEVSKLDIKNNNTIAKIANTKMLQHLEIINKNISLDVYYDREFLRMYSGGLTDVFKHFAEGKILTVDVNSMYPYAMTQKFPNPMSIEEYEYEDKTDEYINDYFWDMLRNYPNGKSIVTIQLKKNTNKKIIDILKRTPLIPCYKTAYNNYFDGYVYEVEVMNVELANLLNPILKECVEIIPKSSIHSMNDELIEPFKDFITKEYNERLEAKDNKNDSLTQIKKMIMNSSYGYLAMQNQKMDYIIGNSWTVASRLYNYGLESGEFPEDVKTFSDFIKESKPVIDLEDETNTRAKDGIYEYVEYLKTHLSDFSDFEINSLEQVIVDTNRFLGDELYVCFVRGKRIPSNQACFILASEITAKSRAYLGRLALEVFDSGNEVCYCDTDSLHIEVKNEESLTERLDDYIDSRELGKMKNEGEYELGVWLAKKHYYLFKKEDDKYVMYKSALKGFTQLKDLDAWVYKRSIVNVSKMACRIKNVSFAVNNFVSDKSFLNFTTSRSADGTFYPIIKNDNKVSDSLFDFEINEINHSKEITALYWQLIDRGDLYVQDENKSLKLISRENIDLRIKEIEDYISKNSKIGVYEMDCDIDLLPKSVEKKLAKELGYEKEDKYRNRKKRVEDYYEYKLSYEQKRNLVKKEKRKEARKFKPILEMEFK